MQETPKTRIKRLSMRAHRRGMKEMDLILGRFADDQLAGLGAQALDSFEALLAEIDQDLYAWCCAAAPVPARFTAIISQIRASL